MYVKLGPSLTPAVFWELLPNLISLMRQLTSLDWMQLNSHEGESLPQHPYIPVLNNAMVTLSHYANTAH